MGKVISYHSLQNNCKVCGKRADWNVVTEEPSTARTIGGQIMTGYCKEHLPISIQQDIPGWYKTAQTPPSADWAPEVRERYREDTDHET